MSVSKNVTLPADLVEGDPRGNRVQGWTQTDQKAHKAMWQLGVKHPTAVAILHFMVSKLNRGTSGIVVSSATIASEMGISTRTVQSAVAVLRECKFLQVLKTGNTNVYIINSQVAWRGERGSRFASFNAEITVSEKEQEQDVDKLIAEAAELMQVPNLSFDGEIFEDVIEGEAKEKLALGQQKELDV